jgi:sialic acid synthase SpsE
MVEAVKSLSKGAEMIAYALVLSQKRIAKLKAANKAATRRKLYKRKRVQKGGALVVEEGLRLTTLKEFGVRSDRKKVKKRVRVKVGELL